MVVLQLSNLYPFHTGTRMTYMEDSEVLIA
uniref:Uncharacterized protein n=1 Tax=Arundo donax TaxID=35708 RepID=A0A0A8XPY0_ARUDO